MFTFVIHYVDILEGLLNNFFDRYGSEVKANIKLADHIMQFFWDPNLIKVQIPPEKTIDLYLSSTDNLVDRTEVEIPFHYTLSVYCELKFRDYNFSWQQD